MVAFLHVLSSVAFLSTSPSSSNDKRSDGEFLNAILLPNRSSFYSRNGTRLATSRKSLPQNLRRSVIRGHPTRTSCVCLAIPSLL